MARNRQVAYWREGAGDFPPKIHSLLRPAEQTDLSFSTEQKDVLADLNRYNIAGRYPDMLEPVPDRAAADVILQKAERIYQW
jgi:HEPN domain-containing protein